MNDRSNTWSAWDRDHFFHPSTPMGAHARGETPARVMATAEGCFITDTAGRRSLDAFAGLYCVNVGYGRQEIVQAIARQAEQLAYYHAYAGHGSEASITLAKMIIDRAPAGMSRVYFGMSGSDANETNIKLAWYYNNVLGRPEKKKVISRWRAYHGSGIMTGSLTGLESFHARFDLPRPPILHTEAPYYYRRQDGSMTEEQFSQHCADRLEELILAEGPDTVAAFFGEPVLGTGGIVPPPAGYWAKIQAVLKKYDVLLVVDEVVTGFGRLGSMFGSDHYGLKPDLITIAKGLTSAYLPLSGSIVSEKVWRVLVEGADRTGVFSHGWTYSAHPVSAAAGVANLQLLDELGLVENAGTVGAYLQARLKAALSGHRHIGEVRGEGLMAAVEVVDDKDDRRLFASEKKIGPRLAAEMLERGVIVRALPQGDILGLAPPLCLTTEEADTIVDALAASIESVLGR